MLKSYATGFLLSIVFTLVAFFMVLRPGFFGLGSGGVIAVILGLAFVQFAIQLFFFLHLGAEPKPHWNGTVFVNTMFIVFLIVAGSLWIMHHLNYNMTPEEMHSYILEDEGIQK